MGPPTLPFAVTTSDHSSQYFLWYIVLLPLYLPYSSFAKSARLSVVAVVLWAGCQVLWLREGFRLEFLGESTFVPGLWLSSLAFYLTNCWILGIIVQDGMESGMKRQV